jgi:hypothetical protein
MARAMFRQFITRVPWVLIAMGGSGFLLGWQAVWIIRPGMLSGVEWPIATIGFFASDVALVFFAIRGIGRLRPAAWVKVIFFAAFVAMNIVLSEDPLLSAVGWMRWTLLLVAYFGLPTSFGGRRSVMIGLMIALLSHVGLAVAQFMALHATAFTFAGVAPHAAWIRGDAVVVAGGERWLRAYGGFAHPNVLGTVLVVGLLVLHSWWGTLRRGATRISAMCVTMFFVFGIILTFSRSAWLAFLVLVVLSFARHSTRTFAAVCLVSAFALSIPFAPLISARVFPSSLTEMQSITSRVSGIDDARELSVASPLFGSGLHAMPFALMQRDPGRSPFTAQPVHNVLLLLMVELGLAGFVMMLIVFLLRTPVRFSFAPEWLVLLPALLFDHFILSLAVGPAVILFVALASAQYRASLDSR